MGWSYEDQRFEVTACTPARARAGQTVTIAIEGENRGAHRDGQGWFARLVPSDQAVMAADAEAWDLAVPPGLSAAPVRYRHGEGDRFALSATFELPRDARGRYQLVVGRGDPRSPGDVTRYHVDAGESDGAFVIA